MKVKETLASTLGHWCVVTLPSNLLKGCEIAHFR